MLRRLRSPALLALCALGLAPASAGADTLHTEASARDGDFVAVEELSYEMIVDTGSGVSASQATRVSLRVTLYNDSDLPQDAVHALALPRTSRLRSFAVRRGGEDWVDGIDARNRSVHAQRDTGSIYAREVPPPRAGELPRAELSAFGLAPGSTTQIELRLDVFPTLDGDRWALDLPRRNIAQPNLQSERRVIVRGLDKGEQFEVDGAANGKAKFMSTRAGDTVTLTWPAKLRGGDTLEGQLEVMRDPQPKGTNNAERGAFRIALRLGARPAKTPDHVILVVDRSRSTSTHMGRSSARVFSGILDTLPANTTFEVVSFARDAELLVGGEAPGQERRTKSPRANDSQARMQLTRALDTLDRAQGSNIAAAMHLVGERLATRQAKRPLVIVVTDGVFPASARPAVIADHLRSGQRSGSSGDKSSSRRGDAKAPDMLFLVDDPLLERSGLEPEAPVARIAAEFGARIRVDTLASIARADLEQLLASPEVLTDLDLKLPANVELDGPLPSGLVAGHVAVIEGRYEGRAPAQLTVRGRLGRTSVSQKLRANARPPTPEALVVAGDFVTPETAAAEGFALPTWHGASLARETELSIAQVSYDTGPRRGHIDQDIVRRYMHMRVFPRASVCYNRELARNQVLQGRVLFEVELGKGEVMAAKIAEQKFNYGVTKDFVDCLTEAAWALEVPAGRLDADTYVVRYPLRFNPPQGGKAPSASDEPDQTFEMLMQRADGLTELSNQRSKAPPPEE